MFGLLTNLAALPKNTRSTKKERRTISKSVFSKRVCPKRAKVNNLSTLDYLSITPEPKICNSKNQQFILFFTSLSVTIAFENLFKEEQFFKTATLFPIVIEMLSIWTNFKASNVFNLKG